MQPRERSNTTLITRSPVGLIDASTMARVPTRGRSRPPRRGGSLCTGTRRFRARASRRARARPKRRLVDTRGGRVARSRVAPGRLGGEDALEVLPRGFGRRGRFHLLQRARGRRDARLPPRRPGHLPREDGHRARRAARLAVRQTSRGALAEPEVEPLLHGGFLPFLDALAVPLVVELRASAGRGGGSSAAAVPTEGGKGVV